MGQRIQVSCDNCHFQKEMAVGAGLLSRRPDFATDGLSEEDAQEWRRLSEQNEVTFFRSEHKVSYCSHCGELVCQTAVEAEFADGSEVKLGGRCKTCGGELKEIDMQDPPEECPICGDGKLEWKKIGLWD